MGSTSISRFPKGKHLQQAVKKIEWLATERSRLLSAKQLVLDNLATDPNSYSVDEILELIKQKLINREELLEIGIPGKIIECLDATGPHLVTGPCPSSVPDGYTEVYMWGSPGAGKTTAFAAILSTLHKEGYLSIMVGPGYDYTTRLKNIFHNSVGILPNATRTDIIQHLLFTMRKPNKQHGHSIAFMQLAGEMFQCFYSKNAGFELPTQTHQDTFELLDKFLHSNNRKIHFFLVKYEAANNFDVMGYTQSDYLSAAATYFENNEIFEKTTDAVYIIVTRSELMPCPPENRAQHALDFLKEANFTSFMNTLSSYCHKHGIQGGVVPVLPFSIGKIYFNALCELDPKPANEIIEILFDKTSSSTKGIEGVSNK